MALTVRGVTAGYSREVPILKNVGLEARTGVATVLIGPNGAGKSTLLRAIYGYLRPSAGEILHDGVSLVGVPPARMLDHGIAYLLQGRSTFPAMTVEENLQLGAWTIRKDRARVRQAFERIYARYPQLKERRRRPAGAMSGGEQRLLEVARLTMAGPRTLLLDEPSVGLMPKLVDEVYAEIARLKQDRYTIVIVDQNVKQAIEIADWVYVLNLGENSRQGPVEQFRQRLDEIVREWL